MLSNLNGFSDFSHDQPPQSCGYDETSGEDTFCCEDTDPSSQRVDKPQPPLFPNDGSNSRSCIDHTSHCARWVKDHPESCKAGNPGYAFMREVCQESCGRCTDKVDKSNCCLETRHFLMRHLSLFSHVLNFKSWIKLIYDKFTLIY